MKSLIFLLCACATACGQMDGVRAPKNGKSLPTQIAQPELPVLLSRTALVDATQKLLWPDSNESIKDGPVDGTYFSLTKAEIEDVLNFIKARHEFIPYIPEAWDCDDFALEFHYFGRLWAVRYTGGVPIAPAIGIAYVKLDGPYPLFSGEPYVSGVYHAINVIFRNDGQWFFVEPQNGDLVPIENSIYEGAIEVIRIVI